jgi:hypothetical protein
MNASLKLDSSLLLALESAGQGRHLFDVVVGFGNNQDAAAVTSSLRKTPLARLGPRTAKGSVTRDQLFKIAAQPEVKYLRLVERLVAAR